MIRAIGSVERADGRSLAVRVPGWPGHRPGQFAMLQLAPRGPGHDPLLGRPMAVYRAEGEVVEFRFKVVGRGTAAMAALRPDDELGIVGPLGNGFPLPRRGVVLVGGGTGIASLYEVAREAEGPVTVALGGRSRSDILGLADFEELGVELKIASEDGSAGTRGLVTSVLELEADRPVFACGPTPMMRAIAELAAAAGATCRVSLENPMACGFGICLGCVVETRRGNRYTCTHGPVFDAADVVWDSAE